MYVFQWVTNGRRVPVSRARSVGRSVESVESFERPRDDDDDDDGRRRRETRAMIGVDDEDDVVRRRRRRRWTRTVVRGASRTSSFPFVDDGARARARSRCCGGDRGRGRARSREGGAVRRRRWVGGAQRCARARGGRGARTLDGVTKRTRGLIDEGETGRGGKANAREVRRGLTTRRTRADGTVPTSVYVDGPTMPVEASGSAPSGAAVRGHPRWDARRLFDEVEVTFRDLNGGFNGARCALHHVWTVSTFNTTTNVTTMEWKSAPATAPRGKTKGSAVALVGPYEKGYLITPRCRASGTLKYTVSAKSSFQVKLVARLVAGVTLLLVAPAVANSVTCFYTLAMTLSTLALVLIVIHRLARSFPGGRMVKRTFTLAGFAMYHFVPNEQWENVTNMYWRMTMKPMRLVISLIKKRYANASLETIIAEDPWALYGALTGFGLLVLGAGVGRWLVTSFVLDAVTGGVAGPVRSSVTMLIRIIGCGLIQFSSRDVPCATAMVAVAVTYCLYTPVIRASDRIVDAAGRFVHRGSVQTGFDDGARVRQEYTSSDSESEDEGSNGGLFALGLRRRARRPLPATLDPDPRTPPRRLDARTQQQNTTPRPSMLRGIFSSRAKSSTSDQSDTDPTREEVVPPLGAAAAAYGRYLSEEEHEHVGRIRTDEAIAQLAQSPEFSAWIAKNAHRVRIVR